MLKNETSASKFAGNCTMEKALGVSACNSKGLPRGQLSNIEDGLELSVRYLLLVFCSYLHFYACGFICFDIKLEPCSSVGHDTTLTDI